MQFLVGFMDKPFKIYTCRWVFLKMEHKRNDLSKNQCFKFVNLIFVKHAIFPSKLNKKTPLDVLAIISE